MTDEASGEKGYRKKDYGWRQLDQAAIGGTDDELEVAQAAAIWLPQAKLEEEITITPPKLKDDPMLPNDEGRALAVETAFNLASKFFIASDKGQLKKAVGQKQHTMAIILEVFRMNPGDVIGDEGALADIVAYIEVMLMENRGLPEEVRNRAKELMGDINKTWDLPDNMFTSSMYGRVNWEKRSQGEEN